MTTITRINENTLSVITSDDAEPTIVQRSSDLTRLIEFGTVEAQNHFWNMLLDMATGSVDPRHPVGPKTAELEMLSNRIDELERDIEMHGKQLEDLENADPADIDEAHLHDLVVDLVKSDENGTIRRKVLEVVRDALS